MADRSVRVWLRAQVAEYKKAMQEAAEATKKPGQEALKSETSLGKMVESATKNREAWSSAGRVMTAFGVATALALGSAVSAAMSWESAWTGVLKTVDGSSSQLAEVEDGLRALARERPATHVEIAGVAESAGQLGVATENVVDFTAVMVDLGETTDLSAGDAATAIAQLMNIMQTAPDQVDNLGASLVALGNDGASTESQIIQMAQRIASSGKIIGLSEGEVMGLANALASVGIEVEAGGSAVSNILIDIAKAVSTGSEDLTSWAEAAGMSAGAFQQAWKAAPAETFAAVIEGLGRMNAEGGDVFSMLEDLGQSDVRVTRALLSMANSGDLLTDSLELGNRAWAENTALAEEAGKRYETAESRIAMAKNSINDSAITLGSALLPAVAEVADAVANVADWFGRLPEPVQTGAALLGGLAGATSLAAGAFLMVTPRIIDTVVGLKQLRADGSRIPGVMGGITKAAGIAAAALVTFEVASRLAGSGYDNVATSEQIVTDLLNLGSAGRSGSEGLELAGEALDKLFTADGSSLTAIDGIESALRSINQNGAMRALDWVGSVGGLFDTQFELGSRAVSELDQALTQLASSGESAEVEAALDVYIAAAQAVGMSTEDAMALLPEYQNHLATAAREQENAADSALMLRQEQVELAESMGYVGEMTEEAQKALQSWRDMVGEAFGSFSDGSEAFQAVIDANTAAAQAQADAWNKANPDSETTKAWEDFYDGLKVAASDYLAELEKQIELRDQWAGNLFGISERLNGLDLDADTRAAAASGLDELAGKGDAGAAEVALIAGMTDEEFAQRVDLWRRAGEDAKNEFTAQFESSADPMAYIDASADPAYETWEELKSAIEGATLTAKIDLTTSSEQAFKDAAVEMFLGAGTASTMAGSGVGGGGGGGWNSTTTTSSIDLWPGKFVGMEDGGILGDGPESHIAQIVPAGTYRVFGEDETGGEAYVPLSPAKRARSLEITDVLARKFGKRLVAFGDGGFFGDTGRGVPANGGVQVVQVPVHSRTERYAPVSIGTAMFNDMGDLREKAERRSMRRETGNGGEWRRG